MNHEIKILLVDDHPLFRKALNDIVTSLFENSTTYEASSVSEALQYAERSLLFDIVLLDLNLPDANGVNTLIPISQAFSETNIVIISANEHGGLIATALSAGACGYIPKSSSDQEIRNALTLVINGGVYIPPAMLENLSELTRPNDIETSMTPRQKDVLMLLAQGKSNKEISSDLGIAETTVRVHVSDIIRIFRAKNRTDAAMQAQKLGLVE